MGNLAVGPRIGTETPVAPCPAQDPLLSWCSKCGGQLEEPNLLDQLAPPRPCTVKRFSSLIFGGWHSIVGRVADVAEPWQDEPQPCP